MRLGLLLAWNLQRWVVWLSLFLSSQIWEYKCRYYIWLLGTLTEVPMYAWQMLYQLCHIPTFSLCLILLVIPFLTVDLQRSRSLEDTNPSISLQVRQEVTLWSWASLIFNWNLSTNSSLHSLSSFIAFSIDLRRGSWPFRFQEKMHAACHRSETGVQADISLSGATLGCSLSLGQVTWLCLNFQSVKFWLWKVISTI